MLLTEQQPRSVRTHVRTHEYTTDSIAVEIVVMVVELQYVYSSTEL